MSIQIGKFIAKALNDSTAVKAIVGTKVFPVAVPDAELDNVPYICYCPENIQMNDTKDGTDMESANVNVIVCANSYELLIDLAEKVKNAIFAGDLTNENWPFQVVDIQVSCGPHQYDASHPCYWLELVFNVETYTA